MRLHLDPIACLSCLLVPEVCVRARVRPTGGHSIDQMLKQHSMDHNGTWTVGSNLKYQPRPSDDTNVGLFFQDRDQFSSTIMQRRMLRRRMLRATWVA